MKIEFRDYKTGDFMFSIPVVSINKEIVTERILRPMEGITDFWVECALYCVNCDIVSDTIDDENDNPLVSWVFVK